MFETFTFPRSATGIALLGVLGFAAYTSFIWINATNIANDRWKVQLAVANEKVRQKTQARARRVEEECAQIDQQAQARVAAKKQSQELRDAIVTKKADGIIAVGPERGRVSRRTLYSCCRGGAARSRRPGQP